MRRLHDDVPLAGIDVGDLRDCGSQVEVPSPAIPDAGVPKPLRDASGRSGGRGGEKGDDERAPGLAEDDCGEETGEEEDRDEGGAAVIVERKRWRKKGRV